jgi:hypothetical protein
LQKRTVLSLRTIILREGKKSKTSWRKTQIGHGIGPVDQRICPHKEFLFKHPKHRATLSMKNTSVMKKGGIFSTEFLKVFLPSLLLSHLLAIELGIYIKRHLTASTSTCWWSVWPCSQCGFLLSCNSQLKSCCDPGWLQHLCLFFL